MSDKEGDPYYSVVYGTYLKGALVGSKYRVDFVHINDCVTPSNTYMNLPFEATKSVYIRNDGLAAIYYSINAPNINVVVGGYLIRGKDRDLKFNRANIKSVNIYVVDPGDASTSADISIETVK